MFTLPSFLAWPISLPAIPSLPSISLPANIQRRFLSYVLKRALGRFVKAGGLDVERIQAQIGEGRVEIEGLEVDQDEINALLPPSLPLTLTSGSLALLSARLPFPNLWSAPLSISLDTLTLEFAITSSPTTSEALNKGKAPSPRSHARRPPTVDLAESVTSAADDFLHEELDAYEEAELDRSIRQSLVLSQTDPFTQDGDGVPGAFPSGSNLDGGADAPLPANVESTTVLAGLVERVLARLEFRVKSVRVRITHEDEQFGGTFELRIGEVRYADESSSAEGSAQQQTVRSVRLSDVAIFMLPSPTAASSAATKSRPPRSSRSSSTASASSSSSDEPGAEMFMSQAVADLRQSVMTASVASGASVYESALSEAPSDDVDEARTRKSPTASEPRSRSTTPTGARDAAETLLLSFGTEDIIVTMKTTRPQNPSDPVPPPQTTAAMPSRTSTPASVQALPMVDLQLSIGTIASILLPFQAAILLSALQTVTRSPPTSAQPSTLEVPLDPWTVSQPRFTAQVHIRAVSLVVVYDMVASDSPTFHAALPEFWSKPSTVYLPVGHVKLRLEALEGKYVTKGYVPRSGHARSRPDRAASAPLLARRGSQSVHFGPPAPILTVVLADASLFEYLASDPAEDDGPPGGAYPVLLFDTGLPNQYALSTGAAPTSARRASEKSTSPVTPSAVFPDFECIDWRNAKAKGKGGESSWKVRPSGRGVLKGVRGLHEARQVLVAKKELGPDSVANVDLVSMHFFLDLSLVERLLPLLRSITPAIRPSTDSLVTPVPSPKYAAMPLGRTADRYILDDLDAQASSQATLQPALSSPRILELKCPMIRLDIRCPAPVARRGSWGNGGHLRSGIVTLDVHKLDLKVDGASARSSAADGKKNVSVAVEWEKMVFFFCRVPDQRSSAFLLITPLTEPTELASSLPPILPALVIATLPPQSSSAAFPIARPSPPSTDITLRIPSVQARIRQSTIEGLQFFADDMTHWLNGAFGDGSAPKPRDDLKMIGSRFFGSKGSSSASSSIDDEDETASGPTRIRLIVSEVDIALLVPRKEDGKERELCLRASDVDAQVETQAGMTLDLKIMDATFLDRMDAGSAQQIILSRTTPFSLVSTAQNRPILHLRFSSMTDAATLAKETDIGLVLSCFTFTVTKDYQWATELVTFVKTPEGVFEDVVPSEVTRINVEVSSGAVCVSPPPNGGAITLLLGSAEVRTEISGGGEAEESVVSLGVGTGWVLAIDDLKEAGEVQVGWHGSEGWRKAGWAQMVEMVDLQVEIARDLTGSGDVQVDILHTQVKVTGCADSFKTFGMLAGDIGKLVPQKPPSEENGPMPSALEKSVDVFSSIDEDAFARLPDVISNVDMIDDDLPTNLDYLDQARHSNAPKADRSTGETLRTWQDAEEENPEMAGETVRMLYDGEFHVQEGYWDSLRSVHDGLSDETRVGNIRVRLHHADLAILLHDGYDWRLTRKTIEDEIKSVRRRLERIRQLLASGQKADASADSLGFGTQSVLFNSVFIGLDRGEDMDDKALLAAIDEELDELGGDETASHSSWQTDFPGGVGAATPGARKPEKRVRLRGKRLTRSKKPQVEIALQGVKADVDVYAEADDDDDHGTGEMASRVHCTVKSMEILDHIKTSTWKKFLTEMKADGRGNVRETGAEMVRVELVGVRPGGKAEVENRLKAKILPLRLHVDQDALDFLKRFFSFAPPAPALAIPSGESDKKAPSPEPFFQHVEIFPIELKLDYKPKRVDFAALREGRTIELMNFFHFDGAEMTLRHITMSGITGWERLGTALQDIWTPDVKANQLADVISGVSPIRSVVNVGSGVADLILLPIEQYRKDGRLSRGMQRGTSSFVRSTALEMMKLGARLATGTQVVLEKAEGVLGGKLTEGTVVGDPAALGGEGDGWTGVEENSSEDEVDLVSRRKETTSRYANQPGGVKEGVEEAYRAMARNVNSAAQTILAVPMEVYERSGDDGPLKAVVRAVPIAVLKPMIGASEAVSKTLLGMRNSLDPEGRRELGDKYK